MPPNWRRLGGIAALCVIALVGPMVTGPAGPPSLAPAAAQLLAPGSRIQEATLADGGLLRAVEIRVDDDAVRVRSTSGWRSLAGVTVIGPVRDTRLWLGSDHQGRSLLARTLVGARTSLTVSLLATLLAVGLGTFAGLTAALVPGWIRFPVSVATDGMLGVPRLLLLLMLGVIFRGSLGGVAVAIALASWMEIARIVEAESRSLLAFPFLVATRASGAGRARLALRHLLPNLTPVLAAAAPLVATQAILLESTLSFLGVAGGAGAASWGGIVADGQRFLPEGWWIAVLPGILLVGTALAFHGLTRDFGPTSGSG